MHASRHLHHLRRTHWVWHLVLLLVMVCGQATAAQHRLQHSQPRADGDAVHSTCLECLALHAVDQTGPVGTRHVVPASNAGHAAPLQALALPPALRPLRAYRSRAPPAFSA